MRKPEAIASIKAQAEFYKATGAIRRRMIKVRLWAGALVNTAIGRGELTRLPCESCGLEKTEAHHEDYGQPLEVRWLCKKHHAERHVEINTEKGGHNSRFRKEYKNRIASAANIETGKARKKREPVSRYKRLASVSEYP